METAKRANRPDITLTSPAELLSAVPYLLGYHPSDSMVLIGMAGDGIAVTARAGLPGRDEPPDRLGITAHALQNNEVDGAILVGYGPADRVTRCVDWLRRLCDVNRIDLVEALRVTEGRFWSYLCEDTECCPVEGTAVPGDDSSVAAEFTLAGSQALPSRETLIRQLAPVTGRTRQAVADATRRLLELVGDGDRADRDTLRDKALAVLDHSVATGELPSLADTVWLGVALEDNEIHDAALRSVDRPGNRTGVSLWIWLTRHVQAGYRARAAALLAYAAWRAGNGVLAAEAVAISLAGLPEGRLAGLMRHILTAGTPPWKTVEFGSR
ncbi:uncharacterized protein DUF4192 [Stackebrandtia albiflava]|uniref:Uncharacterized protein DUF4192 n=1 Tax=Stackebrandtia albiflava TaxID=406432 RepID=A0A562V105_9ACTN|nr:DUF4192 domain-containing protein [Stackebrandtia albiflava]TWJ11600.1 uncharacterized protein DUF4192 [Stackebrandtia albiflava]